MAEVEAGGLLTRARAGDADAFAELVAPHRRELQVHCYRMLASLQDAEDAADAFQDTLLSAWRGLGGYEERTALRTWPGGTLRADRVDLPGLRDGPPAPANAARTTATRSG